MVDRMTQIELLVMMTEDVRAIISLDRIHFLSLWRTGRYRPLSPAF